MNLFIWLGNKIGGWLSKPDPREMAMGSSDVRRVFHTAHDRASGEAWTRELASRPSQRELAVSRIAQIKRERASLMAQIAKAEKRHEPRAELRAKLAKLTAEQLAIERLWECG